MLTEPVVASPESVGTSAWGGAERRRDAGLAALKAGFEALGVPVAVFDSRGRLRHANAGARQRLQRSGGWQWLNGQRLDRVCRDGRRLMLELQDGEMVALQPLDTQEETLAAAVFSLPALAEGIGLQLYASHCGLTGAECRVLALLSEGWHATEIAQRLGVANSTVLSHVSAIRAKTACRSVRQLLHRLAALPPLACRQLENCS